MRLAALAFTFMAGAALAQSPGVRSSLRIEFDAPTYANFGGFRAGRSNPGKAAMTIHLPLEQGRAREGRVPAVVIAHSIGGWNDAQEGVYVRPLLEAGFAVIALDHFGPRGIRRAADVPGAISPVTPASDALLALRRASEEPTLDRARIGIMGLSMGGITAELAAYELVRRAVLGDGDLRFAGHLALYAPCGQVFLPASGPVTTGAPMLLLYGGLDETTPRAKCDRIDALIRAAEPAVNRRAIWYPDGTHAWEIPRPPRFMPHHVNARKCPVVDWGAKFRVIDNDGGERPFSNAEFQACTRESAGYTIGRHDGAAADAMKQMLGFFGEALK